MKFSWCTITVNDLDESVKFYQDIVGLSVDKRYKAGPGTEIAFLGEGETKVELIYHENAGKSDIGKDISIGFEVESVSKKIEELKSQGIEIAAGPISPSPHIEFFFVLDPNGLKIQFIENK